MRILVATDSFKGSLSASEASEAIARGIRMENSDIEVIVQGISDGGDGVLDVIADALDAENIKMSVTGPLGKPVIAKYLIDRKLNKAYIEMAEAAGLQLIPICNRNPLYTTTFGIGEMINDAIFRGCREISVFLGGSGTNDGGAGCLQALGAKFFDRNGNLIVVPITGEILSSIDFCDTRGLKLDDIFLHTACDVDNPFYGPNGATYVFGPQKGANPEDLSRLDNNMKHLCEIYQASGLKDIGGIPGAGAAGGLGGGLMTVGAIPSKGAELIFSILKFKDLFKDIDMLVTGEGSIDAQTLHGKAPFVAMRCASENYSIPTVAVAGKVSDRDALIAAGFNEVICCTPSEMPVSEAMKPSVAIQNLESVGREIAHRLI